MADLVALPNPLWNRVAENVRAFRLARRCTQDELAEAVGLARTSIANLEAGRQRISLDTIYDIAVALDIGVGQLLPERSMITP